MKVLELARGFVRPVFVTGILLGVIGLLAGYAVTGQEPAFEAAKYLGVFGAGAVGWWFKERSDRKE